MASYPHQHRPMHWGYCRVSSEEQLAGQSVDSQHRRLLDAGIPEHQICVEVGSATKARTPELHKLFARARKGEVKSILAIRQDRFQRNRQTAAALWELIDIHKVAFRFLDQPDIDPADPTSVLQAQILGAFAQFETEQLSQRVKNGLQQNRLMKKHHGRPPAGYINVNGHLQPDPETWDSYRKVVECYLETGSSTAARKLRHELIGKPWGASAFARWILAENLRGAVVHGSRSDNKEVFWEQHKPMLSASEWDQIQTIRAKNKTNTGAFRGTRKKPELGSGLMRCADCGGRLTLKTATRGDKVKLLCKTVKGGGCSQGYLNWIAQSDVPDIVRSCIGLAAMQLAEVSTPHKLAEPPELSDLRLERESFLKVGTGRALKQVEAIDAEIAAMVSRLELEGPERHERARAEFLRLSDDNELAAMTADELRSLALRYGLEIDVDHRQVCRIHWDRLGPLTVEAGEGKVVAMGSSGGPLPGMDMERWAEFFFPGRDLKELVSS